MSLQIFIEEDRAHQVFRDKEGVNFRRRWNAAMGEFAVAHNSTEGTALGTSGAASCIIIIVHKERGWGALGHFLGHNDTNLVLAGIKKMVERLEGPPIREVVFAAGRGAVQQVSYEACIMGDVRGLYSGAYVTWQKASQENLILGACCYLPHAEQIGFFVHLPGHFGAPGSEDFLDKNSISLDAYPLRAE
jgi:hypothetical protein